jgi:hypothetical protein
MATRDRVRTAKTKKRAVETATTKAKTGTRSAGKRATKTVSKPATTPKTGKGAKATKAGVRPKKAVKAVTKAAKPEFGSTKSSAAKRHPTKTPPIPSAVTRLRQICLALPETTEVEAWGEPTFRVKGKIFAMHASSGNHHGSGRPGVWILSVSMEQDLVLRARPDRYFKPPYVGPSGWIGAWLDNNPPWAEIEELLRDGWRRRAPKKIVALLGE